MLNKSKDKPITLNIFFVLKLRKSFQISVLFLCSHKTDFSVAPADTYTNLFYLSLLNYLISVTKNVFMFSRFYIGLGSTFFFTQILTEVVSQCNHWWEDAATRKGKSSVVGSIHKRVKGKGPALTHHRLELPDCVAGPRTKAVVFLFEIPSVTFLSEEGIKSLRKKDGIKTHIVCCKQLSLYY